MKLIRGQEEKVMIIKFLFLGMMKETANSKRSFLLNVHTIMGNHVAVPVLDNAVRGFLFAASWAEVENGISLTPCGLHLPNNARMQIPQTEQIKNWDDVVVALKKFIERYTEGFMITFVREPKCDEEIY